MDAMLQGQLELCISFADVREAVLGLPYCHRHLCTWPSHSRLSIWRLWTLTTGVIFCVATRADHWASIGRVWPISGRWRWATGTRKRVCATEGHPDFAELSIPSWFARCSMPDGWCRPHIGMGGRWNIEVGFLCPFVAGRTNSMSIVRAAPASACLECPEHGID